ncbi:hypothetical protein ACRXCV_00200 (plasmid) [Halobacteriovorax sp. GFR7]|uniref:hypothetical protein n=1 Tax=unclassified Halobacteriovorax TaxID=2639665 RepID=UPI003D95EB71
MAVPSNLTEYLNRVAAIKERLHGRRGSDSGEIEQELLELMRYGGVEYGGKDSLAGISLPTGLTELERTITLVATADPLVAITPVHVTIADVPDQFKGDSLTANGDGTITVNRDVLALAVTSMCTARFASNSNVVLGVGIGDPANMPSMAGTSTAVLPDGTYLSRFYDNTRGQGNTRQVTFQTPYYPVSKTGVIGAKEGDKVFPVLWTQENANTSVIVDELIFTVETYPLP